MNEQFRVLLVDDNLGMLETMADILNASGLNVDTANDGPSAIAMFKTRPYDAAVVDIIMPGMNGIELIKRLKPDFPNTRFIVLTAYSNTPLAMEAEQIAAVLHKPVDPGHLIRLIRELQPAATD